MYDCSRVFISWFKCFFFMTSWSWELSKWCIDAQKMLQTWKLLVIHLKLSSLSQSENIIKGEIGIKSPVKQTNNLVAS